MFVSRVNRVTSGNTANTYLAVAYSRNVVFPKAWMTPRSQDVSAYKKIVSAEGRNAVSLESFLHEYERVSIASTNLCTLLKMFKLYSKRCKLCYHVAKKPYFNAIFSIFRGMLSIHSYVGHCQTNVHKG